MAKPKDSVRSDHYVETPVFKNAFSKQALELAKETAKIMHALEEEFYGTQGWLEELQTSLNEIAADDDPEELEESVRVLLDWNDSLKGMPHGYSQTLHSMERLYDDITDKVAEEFEKHRTRRARDLEDEPAYRLGQAIGQLKDVLNYIESLAELGGKARLIVAELKRDIERTLREIDK